MAKSVFAPMHKTLLNRKRDELRALSGKDLVDRILSYPNQDLLNIDSDGKKRTFPSGKMAASVRNKDYQMSVKLYHTLIHSFSQATVPELKIVGVTYANNDPTTFDRTLIAKEDKALVYEVPFRLKPMPENPHDPNAVAVMTRLPDGTEHQVGYLSKEFVAAYAPKETDYFIGNVIDWSGGKGKVCSYRVALDLEQTMERAPIKEEGACLYERPILLNGRVPNPDAAAMSCDELPLTRDLNRWLTTYDLPESISDVRVFFTEKGGGRISVETTEPLSAESKRVVTSITDQWMESGTLSSSLKRDGLVDVPIQKNTFRSAPSGFRCVAADLYEGRELEGSVSELTELATYSYGDGY